MPRKYVPKEQFDADLPEMEKNVEDFVKEHYDKNGAGPSFEEIRDGVGLDNDLVTFILRKMAKDGTKIQEISV